MSPTPLHLAVALDGAGWHPAAWREPDARPRELFTAGYWARPGPARPSAACSTSSPSRTAWRCSRPTRTGPTTAPTRCAAGSTPCWSPPGSRPLTRHIGLVPTAIVTHTEPFHVSKAIATLDYVSTGRAGVQVQVSAGSTRPRLFGRRSVPPVSPSDDPRRRR